MDTIVLTLSILRLLGFASAFIFLWFVGKAYLKHRVESLAILFVAIGLLAIGTIIEGVLFQFIGTSIDTAHVVEASFQLMAFLVLVWSVVAHKVE